jgi:hypothetical protein
MYNVRLTWFRLSQSWRSLSSTHRAFLLFQVAAIAFAIFWLFRLPPTGYAAVVLGVVAIVMSLHEDMKNWQKAIWMFIISVFLLVEFRAINKDRSDQQTAQNKFNQDLADRFDGIGNGIRGAIQNSDENFNKTMSQLMRSFETEKRTESQTQPKADLVVTSIVWKAPLKIGEKEEYTVHFENRGNANAHDVTILSYPYGGLPDSEGAQAEIIKMFAEDRKTMVKQIQSGPATPGQQLLSGSFATQVLTGEMMNAFVSHTATIYVIVEFRYADIAGKWVSDYYFGLKNPFDFTMLYPCKAPLNDHYHQ